MTSIERDELLRGTREGVPHTSKRIQDAALQLFYERGYVSTTMREIALACGLTPGALYNHFVSKDELLGSMLLDIHRELQITLDDAVSSVGDDPRERLKAYARAHAFFHTKYMIEARVANREIGSLAGDNHREIVAIRQRTTNQLRDILAKGGDAGVFDVPSVSAVSNLILTMGMAIANWYHPDRELTRDEMADLHAEMTLRMVTGSVGGNHQ